MEGHSIPIWRHLLVRSDSTLADLHFIIQIAFDWTDFHLHRFRIRGKDYGISRVGGPWFSNNARDVWLADFRFRINEWFLYEYDFSDGWQHQVRLSESSNLTESAPTPFVEGQRAAPPEDCGGPLGIPQVPRSYPVGGLQVPMATSGGYRRVVGSSLVLMDL
jgi:Plasmid pRiA4b ORF-3-like protein.